MGKFLMTLLLALCVGGFTAGCKEKSEPAAGDIGARVGEAQGDAEDAAAAAKAEAEKAKAAAEAEAKAKAAAGSESK